MSSKSHLLCIALTVLCACSTGQKEEKAAIEQVMDAQVIAWNQGDLEGYMNGYWHSDSLIFTGGKGITYGWEDALERYRKSYTNAEAMGQLSFSDVHTQLTGATAAFTVGQWRLDRTSDTLTGRFTLIWNKLKNGQWVIVADHSS